MSVERIYQRKTQLEHILLRPDTYVGSTEESSEQMFVFDSERRVIVKRSVTYVPGLYKIFDEILGKWFLWWAGIWYTCFWMTGLSVKCFYLMPSYVPLQ